MLNCRLQVILTNIVAFIIFLTMPLATMLGAFTVKGEGLDALDADITISAISYSCIIG